MKDATCDSCRTKFEATVESACVVFYAKFLLYGFCAFLLDHSCVTFSRLSSSFLSDLSYSLSETKFVAIIKAIVSAQEATQL